MEDSMENTNVYLASYATFKTLYNENKDIYNIIEEFVKNVLYISDGALSIEDILNFLEDNYGFSIPYSVLKTTLKRLVRSNVVSKNNNMKYYLSSKYESDKFSKIEIFNKRKMDEHNILIGELIDYINSKGISDVLHEDVTDDLFKYLINKDVETQYGKYISSLIIENDSKKESINDLLQEIRDGLILLDGLKYQVNSNEINVYRLNKDLILYLGQEILFNAFGYNGDLLKRIIQDDFLPLINNINNSKNNKGKIKLRYLSTTKDDIDSYFKSAENALLYNRVAESEAMMHILKDCQNKGDVLDKKNSLFCLSQKE